jgi:hypothetical protein
VDNVRNVRKVYVMPQPTRSREWFRQQVAALGALLRRLPPHRQEALLEALEDETPRETADHEPGTPRALKATKDTPAPD